MADAAWLPTVVTKKLAVEVLTSKLTAFGMHPSGVPYNWGQVHSPLDVSPQDLPVIDNERIAKMLDAIEHLFQQHGAYTKKAREAAERRGMEEAAETAVEDRPAIAIAIVKALTNDLPYEEWINVGQGLWNVAGEAGRNTWEAFCRQWPQNTAKVIEDKWRSFQNPRYDELRKFKLGSLIDLYAKPAGIWEKVKPKGLS
jgi:hypothetical protein